MFTIVLDVSGGVLQFVEATAGVPNQTSVTVTSPATTIALYDPSDSITLGATLVNLGWTLSANTHLAMGPETGISSVSIDTKDASDSVAIDSCNLPVQVTPSGSANEVVTLGGTGVAQRVTADVAFDATHAASAELQINDSDNTSHIDPTLTSTSVSGVTPGTISFLPPQTSGSAQGVISVDLKTGTGGAAAVIAEEPGNPAKLTYHLTSGGPDTIAVGALNLNNSVVVSTQPGVSNTVLVGASQSIAGIHGHVSVLGSSAVEINDAADTQSQRFDIVPDGSQMRVNLNGEQLLNFQPEQISRFTLDTGTEDTTINVNLQGTFSPGFTASLETGEAFGDSIAVSGLPAGATLNVDEAGSNGSVDLSVAAAHVLGDIHFTGAAGAFNILEVDAAGLTADTVINVSDSAVTGIGSARITLANVVGVAITGGSEFDEFIVTPSATTQFQVDGGPSTAAPPTDRLVVITSQTPQLTVITDASGNEGHYDFSRLQRVNFSRVGSIMPSFGDVSGTIFNQQTGAPVPGVTVTVDSNGNARADVGERSATSGADGGFAFSGLPAGTYPLLVQSATFSAITPATAVISAGVISPPVVIPVVPVAAASGPDLIATAVASVAGKGATNKPKLQVKITNLGAAMATAASVQVLLVASLDQSLSSNDSKLLTYSTSLRLNARATKTFTLLGNTTTALTTGQYFALASVDAANAVPETNEANNVAASSHTIALAPPSVDLTGKLGKVPPSASKAKILTIPFTLQNTGTVPAGGSTAFNFYASTDRTLDDSDVAIGTSFPAAVHLAPGKTQNLKFKLSINPAIASGSYYLVARINPTQSIAESSYANNQVFSATPIAIA